MTWTAGGFSLAVARPKAVSKTIFAGETAPLTVLMPGAMPKLATYGDFHVVAHLQGSSTTGDLTVAQGSPATWLTVGEGPLTLQLPDRATLTSSKGKPLTSATWSDDEVRVGVPDGSAWTIVLPGKATWNRDGIRLRADVGKGSVVGLVARPTNAGPKWDNLARAAGRHPVTNTLAAWRRQPGRVTQRLTWVGDPGLIALDRKSVV